MALSDRGIRALKPTDKHQFVADGGGLYLRVHTTGTKTFLLRSRKDGGARWVTLGEYPAMSLLDARKAVLDQTGKALPSKKTVQQCYDTWFAHISKSYKSPRQVQQRADGYYLPKFGGRVIESVSRAEWTDFLAGVADRAPVSANRVLGDLNRLLTFAVARGALRANVLAGVSQKTVGGAEKTRARVMTDDEIRRLIVELRSGRFADKTALALALCLLTGQRSGEVRGLCRAEVVDNVWTVPPERTKNGVASSVWLTGASFLLVRLALKLHGDSPFKGMEQQVLSRAMSRMAFTPGVTPHDLRRTMATRMADLGVEPYVIEKCLNHTMAGVMATYNRSAYTSEKRVAFRRWNKHVLSLRPKK